MKHKQSILILVFLFLIFSVRSQTKWTLDSCIHYALENNFTVKQKMLEIETQKIQLRMTKNSLLPAVNASMGQDFDFGRAASANAVIVDNSQSTTSFGVGFSVPLFEGFRTHYQISSNKLNVLAVEEDLKLAENNIEISVTAYYLQVLLCREIYKVAQEQLTQSKDELKRIETLVQSGKSPESEIYTQKATVANDELSVTEAYNNLILAKLDLTQLMNIQADESFDVDETNIYTENASLPELNGNKQRIIDSCLQYNPAIKAARLRLEKSKKDIKVSQAGYYPSLSLSASYGTGYYLILPDNVANGNLPFGKQMSNNSREMIALSLTIPLFDKMATYNNVNLSKINYSFYEIQREEVKNNLIKEIEQAYTNAMVSKDKYSAAQKAKEASSLALYYEEAKYKAGSSTIYDYSNAKIRYQQALSKEIQTKFDYIFRIKILEFYAK